MYHFWAFALVPLTLLPSHLLGPTIYMNPQGSKNRTGHPTGQATGLRVIGSTVVGPGQTGNNKIIKFNYQM